MHAELEQNPEKLSPLRILVIEDEDLTRRIIGRLLNANGHYLELAGSGKDGLDMFRKGSFDLVITDRSMPVMCGDEVAEELQNIQAGIPVIMLTGFGDIMNDSGERPFGVACVVSKPATVDELNSVMASVMREAKKAQ